MMEMGAADVTKRPVPAGWRRVTLGRICELNPRRNEIIRPDNALTSFVPMEAVDAEKGVISDLKLRQYAEVKKGYTYFEEGDILFAKITPCMQNGKHAIARDLIGGIGFASTEFHVIRPSEGITSEWVHYFVRQSVVLQEATNHFTGAVGQQRVPDDFLKALEIPLPATTKEQKRITDILHEQITAVGRARAAAQARLDAAMALPAALLRQAFASFEDTWNPHRLGDVLIPYKEMIHPGDRENGTAEFVGLEHLEPHTGRRLGGLTLDLTELTGRKPAFQKGQIVYGYLRPYLNKVWIAEFDGCSSVDQYAYDVRSSIADPRYIAWFMRSPTYLSRSAILTTTGQLPRIGTQEISAVEIRLPPVDKQAAIADEIDRRFFFQQKLRDSIQAEIDAIDAMPAALLRRAFNGEI